jgi:hypothetical protein
MFVNETTLLPVLVPLAAASTLIDASRQPRARSSPPRAPEPTSLPLSWRR